MSKVGADAFGVLGTRVREALSERGFDQPTEPQRRAVPPIANGDHVLVGAPTGTGKTETAMLPVFDAIVAQRDDGGVPFGISALYVTPLRALNRDMRERLDWWGDRLGLEIDVRHGDTTDYQRRKQATEPPDVLVTTPETLQAMLTGDRLRRALEDVSHVVVDEVHELAAAKRGAQLAIGLERLRELSGEFQRIGLSATVGDPDEVGRFLTGGRECELVEIDAGSLLDVRVVHPEIGDEDEKLAGELVTDTTVASHVRAILEAVERSDSTLIFVNTRQTAEALGSRFKALDANVGVHHGSLATEARVDVEDRFKAGSIDALLCTSSMELGIDVGRIDHVVQYHSPREVRRLLQRVGRAGHRMDRVSEGTIVADRPDDALEAMTIARRGSADLVEAAAIHHGSLDTVANQVAGMVMGYGDVSARRAYETVTGAYPFRDLSEANFRDVVDELSGNRVVWLDRDEDELSTTGNTWQYVYGNLSMIPDEATFDVHDLASGRQVGTLDEQFVVNFAAQGEIFVQGGEMWRITEVDADEERVDVSPVEDPAGEVPTWIGEEIPVPHEVAQEVGELRRVAAGQLSEGAPIGAVARDLAGRYPTDAATAEHALDDLADQVNAGQPIPTDERIVVEGRPGTVVVNAAFGHKVNETLGRVVAALVGQRTGSSVGLDVDPYRIELEVPRDVSATDVADELRDVDPGHVEAILELALKNSDSLKFTLAQVAAKFGRLDGSPSSPDRLLAALEGTPVYEEAIREVFHDDLAVDDAAEVLRRLDHGSLSIEVVGGRTAIGTAGRSGTKELLAPENADASVIDTVRERIQDDKVVLACVHCGDWSRRTKVRRVPDQPECPECGSTRVAALNYWNDETLTAIQSADPDEEQRDRLERAHKAAHLVQSHGRQAVVALVARGVGPTNAARIIGKLREDEDDFYRDILTREREYARTRSFWD